jgi:hypothetical protein
VTASTATPYRPTAASLAGLTIDGIVAVLVDRPWMDQEARANRVTDIWSLIAAFHPQDPFEIMEIGQCLLFNDLVADGARDVLAATEDRPKARARAHTIAMSRELNKHMRALRIAQAQARLAGTVAARFGASADGAARDPEAAPASNPAESAKIPDVPSPAPPPSRTPLSAAMAWPGLAGVETALPRATAATIRETLLGTTAQVRAGDAAQYEEIVARGSGPAAATQDTAAPGGAAAEIAGARTAGHDPAASGSAAPRTGASGATEPLPRTAASDRPPAAEIGSPHAPPRPDSPEAPAAGTSPDGGRGSGAYLPSAKVAARAGPQST